MLSLHWLHCLFLLNMISAFTVLASSWDDWWTYDGISGPDFWGLLNPEWTLCNRGKRQSPVDIRTQELLFDPQLGPIQVDNHFINGLLENNGHAVIFYSTAGRSFSLSNTAHLEDHSSVHHHRSLSSSASALSSSTSSGSTSSSSGSTSTFALLDRLLVTIRGGPLAYTYTFHHLNLHFGNQNSLGSEHRIDGRQFPAEMQIMAYNSDLYLNFEQATKSPNGLATISVLFQIANQTSKELALLTNHLKHIKFRDQNVTVKYVSIANLIPDMKHYVTYEGSMTTPACSETVTWVLVNRPLFISSTDLLRLRQLMQGETQELPKAPLGNNFRPPHSLHRRVIRTNIADRPADCISMASTKYQVNFKTQT